MKRTHEQTRTEMVAFIQAFWMTNSYSPSLREIMDGCHLSSTSLVHYHLVMLEREGKIVRTPNMKRSIRPSNMNISMS